MSIRILQQAEQLYRAGHRQEAIDLLEWHMKGAFASRNVANVLGKLYGNANQPREAAYWFNRALLMGRQVVPSSDEVGAEASDRLGADELDYIASSTGCQPELEFDHIYGFDDSQIPHKPAVPLESDDVDQGQEHDVSDSSLSNETESQGRLGDDQLDQNHHGVAGTDCYDADSDQVKENFLIDDDGIDVSDLEATVSEEESDYDWEEYALEGDPLEASDQDPIEEPPLRISDLRKARQVAGKLAHEADWDVGGLPILIEVLVHHRSHGKTLSALRSLMLEMEVTPHELSLMHELRQYWGGSGYNRIFRGNDACDGWPTLSWALSLRLLRQLKMESADEIFLFVEDCFQNWNDSPAMLSAYPIFSYYLNHIINHMDQVNERCGQPMPAFIDYNLFPDEDSYYESWRLNAEDPELHFQLNI